MRGYGWEVAVEEDCVEDAFLSGRGEDGVGLLVESSRLDCVVREGEGEWLVGGGGPAAQAGGGRWSRHGTRPGNGPQGSVWTGGTRLAQQGEAEERCLERKAVTEVFGGGGDGWDSPRTTSRTDAGSAKASRMNSCGNLGSGIFSILVELPVASRCEDSEVRGRRCCQRDNDDVWGEGQVPLDPSRNDWCAVAD